MNIPTARQRIWPTTPAVVSALCEAGREKVETNGHRIDVEKQILQRLQEAKFIGLVDFVQGPIMEEEDGL